jgi:hypothetical protein
MACLGTNQDLVDDRITDYPEEDLDLEAVLITVCLELSLDLVEDQIMDYLDLGNSQTMNYRARKNVPATNYLDMGNVPVTNYQATKNDQAMNYLDMGNAPAMNYQDMGRLQTMNYQARKNVPVMNYQPMESVPAMNYQATKNYPVMHYQMKEAQTLIYRTVNHQSMDSYRVTRLNTTRDHTGRDEALSLSSQVTLHTSAIVILAIRERTVNQRSTSVRPVRVSTESARTQWLDGSVSVRTDIPGRSVKQTLMSASHNHVLREHVMTMSMVTSARVDQDTPETTAINRLTNARRTPVARMASVSRYTTATSAAVIRAGLASTARTLWTSVILTRVCTETVWTVTTATRATVDLATRESTAI